MHFFDKIADNCFSEVGFLKQISAVDLLKRKGTVFLRQQSFITEYVIHLSDNEKPVRLQILSIIMHASIMILRLKLSQKVSRS